ncbi:hypothetical protein PQR65_25295 [Paraburkholderia nemoris]|uniref:hypothetical protein n=1 Tax=Paraburkholderia nemoris TaxID=2793076 RepID=UPI0038BC8F98
MERKLGLMVMMWGRAHANDSIHTTFALQQLRKIARVEAEAEAEAEAEGDPNSTSAQ